MTTHCDPGDDDPRDTRCDDERATEQYAKCCSCRKLFFAEDILDGLCPTCDGREPYYDDRRHQMRRD